MGQRVAAEGYAEEALQDEDEEEMHWALERLGQASIYLVVASLGVAVLGLGALAVADVVGAVTVDHVGRTMVAAGSLGSMGSMLLATVVAVLSGTFSPF
jgi:hypothetical protein